MATREEIEILLKAQDQASAVVRGLKQELAEAQGQSQATGTGFGQMALQGVAMGAGFLASTEGLKLLGGALSSTSRAVVELAARAEQIQNRSLITGWGVETVQVLDRVAEMSGVSSGRIETAMMRLQRGAVEGSKGFDKLGMSTEAFLALSPEQQLQAAAEKVMSYGTAAERSAAAQALFGKSGAELLPVLAQVAQGTDDVSVAMSGDQVAAMAQLDDALDRVKGGWEDLINQLLVTIASSPEVKEGLETIADVLLTMARNMKQGQQDASALLSILMRIAHLGGPNSPLGLLRAAGVLSGSGAPSPTGLQGFQGLAMTGGGIEGPAAWETERDRQQLRHQQERERAHAKYLRDLAHDEERANRESIAREERFQRDLTALEVDEQTQRRESMKAEQWAGTEVERLLYAARLSAAHEFNQAITDGIAGTNKAFIIGLQTRERHIRDDIAHARVIEQRYRAVAGVLVDIVGLLADAASGTQAWGMTLAQVGQGIAQQLGGPVGGIAGAGLELWMAGQRRDQANAALRGTADQTYGSFDRAQQLAAQYGMPLMGGGIRAPGQLGDTFENMDISTEELQAQLDALAATIGKAETGFQNLHAGLTSAGQAATGLQTMLAEGFADSGGAIASLIGTVAEAMMSQGVGAWGMEGNAAFSQVSQASGLVQQLIAGMNQANLVDTDLLATTTEATANLIAQATEASGLEGRDATRVGFAANAQLLQAQLEASMMSGTGISTELQALLDEARANGINIVASPLVQSLEVQRESLAVQQKMLGALGSAGGGKEEEPPAMARGGVVLPFVPRAERGLVVSHSPGGSLIRSGEREAELTVPVRAVFDLARQIGSGAGGGGRWEVAPVYLDGAKVGEMMVRRRNAGLAG
jgi:hypothetical protein